MFRFKLINIVFVMICILNMSGCGVSYLTSRDTNPVIQDYSGTPSSWFSGKDTIDTFATTASRRMVIKAARDRGNNKDYRSGSIVCSEPSPDVGEAFTSALVNALEVSAKTDAYDGKVANTFARSVATEVAPLLYRSQGIQFYRDAMYSLCIDRLNGWLASKNDDCKKNNTNCSEIYTDNYYNQRKEEIEKIALKLIMMEIPEMAEVQKTYYQNSKVGNSNIGFDSLIFKDSTKIEMDIETNPEENADANNEVEDGG